jgi:hypothetical protein
MPRPTQPSRPVKSADRLRQMLAPRMMTPDMTTPRRSPSSLDEAVMQQYPYSAQGYAPEEIMQYADLLNRNQSAIFPARTDVPASYYGGGVFGEADYQPGKPRAARQDSLYVGQKVVDDAVLQRQRDINEFVRRLDAAIRPLGGSVRQERR